MLLSPMWCLPLGSCWRGFSRLGISAAGTPLAHGFGGGGGEQFECAHGGLVGVVEEAVAMGGLWRRRWLIAVVSDVPVSQSCFVSPLTGPSDPLEN